MNTKAKAAVVTGGAKGIGEAVCLRLAAQGFSVAICCNTSREKAEALACKIKNGGGNAMVFSFDITDDMWHRMIDTNLGGAFYCTRAVLPFMIHRKAGKIINIASVWGETGGSCEVHYSAAKAGLIGMTKALAKELGLSGITVNCVSPGVILTDMTSHFDENTMNELKNETPLNRIGTPEDVAGAVAFLVSADGDFITGQDIPVNGGMY